MSNIIFCTHFNIFLQNLKMNTKMEVTKRHIFQEATEKKLKSAEYINHVLPKKIHLQIQKYFFGF